MKTQKQMQDKLKWYVGQYIDFDGAYQAQCMDLAVDYMYWATDKKYRMWGNAIDAVNDRVNNYGKYATVYKNTKNFLPKVGDIAVWTQAPAHPTYGHIGIVYGDINLNTCTMLDQNWDGDPSKPAKLRTDDYRGVTHFVRINFTGEPAPSKPAASKPATSTPAKTTSVTHKVKKGETLYSISKLHGTTVDKIKSLNKLKDNTILPNQKLIVSTKAASSTPKVVAPKDFKTNKKRGRSLSAYAKGKVDMNDVHIRNRKGSQKVGFNWDTDTKLRLNKGQVVFIFETHNNWVRIYNGDLNGNGSNRWIYGDRVIITEVYKD